MGINHLPQPTEPCTITFNGHTRTIYQWAREVGVEPKTIYRRVESGWPVDECIYGRKHRAKTQPKMELTFQGETRSLKEWADLLGCSRDAIYRRLREGKPLHAVLAGPTEATELTFQGETHTLSAWSKRLGVPYSTLRARLKAGQPLAAVFREYDDEG